MSANAETESRRIVWLEGFVCAVVACNLAWGLTLVTILMLS
ncbi:hypothetical protein [Shewanella sp. WXL01]|nr:hypothetical protein [Shewanella sp. WXL01]